jgi:transcriptional regulator with XRE-family HTH domain
MELHLRPILTRLGVSQAELAHGVGVTSSAVSQWLGGQATPTTSNILAVLEYLHTLDPELTLDDLFKRQRGAA